MRSDVDAMAAKDECKTTLCRPDQHGVIDSKVPSRRNQGVPIAGGVARRRQRQSIIRSDQKGRERVRVWRDRGNSAM